MTSTALFALVQDPSLRDDVDRVAAAAGLRVVHTERPSGRAAWLKAVAVVLDVPAADGLAAADLPRRDRVLLVGRDTPGVQEWRVAARVGAQHFFRLPDQDEELVAAFAAATAECGSDGREGAVLAVLGGCGGAGASLFATALALAAESALLIDADPWSGGIDLALGTEGVAGLRWPDLALRDGRLGFDALRAALPTRRAVTVLSGGRSGGEIEAGPLSAVIAAGRRAGVTVVCDVPRRATAVTEVALQSADLVVVITRADVRAAVAAGALADWARTVNPNLGLVVRGPAPGGLRAADLATGVGLPLLATMRPQPGLAVGLERGGLQLGARSPLATAAAKVLRVLRGQPMAAAS